MNAVLKAIDRHNRHDEAARADALAEQTIRHMGFVHSVSAGARERMRPFIDFCGQHGVGALPARPEIVAAFVLSVVQLASLDRVTDVLEAIESHHDACGLANPVKTAIVAQALDHWPNDAPRSWGAPDKVLFLALPSDVQRVITRRENDRDKALQRKLNDVSKQENKPMPASFNGLATTDHNVLVRIEQQIAAIEPARCMLGGNHWRALEQLREDVRRRREPETVESLSERGATLIDGLRHLEWAKRRLDEAGV